ncbi:MAG: TetR/AcrR family transcriptional regulator [Bacilli bacterium]|nr:TetR/AcrR family transcriptional regulator [Bacilli bacterium]
MPKTKEQFEQIKKERMDAILNASLFLFATKGYNAVTTDEITNYVGCSHGLLYHYFGSKEDLFSTLMDKKVITIMDSILADIDFKAKPKFVLLDVIDALLEATKSNDDEKACAIYLVLNLHLQRKYIPKPKIKPGDCKKHWMEYAIEIIDKGKASGEFYDYNTKEMLVALLAFFKGLTYSRIYLGAKKFTCPKAEIISKMIIKS